MPSKKPLSDAQLAAFEAGQNLEALLVQSAREMAGGQTRRVYTPAIAAREAAGLSQAKFAELLGVSVRTLQQWEQGRREPTGAAKTLMAIARQMPEALRSIDVTWAAAAPSIHEVRESERAYVAKPEAKRAGVQRRRAAPRKKAQ